MHLKTVSIKCNLCILLRLNSNFLEFREMCNFLLCTSRIILNSNQMKETVLCFQKTHKTFLRNSLNIQENLLELFKSSDWNSR
jgi:hypothetical protein